MEFLSSLDVSLGPIQGYVLIVMWVLILLGFFVVPWFLDIEFFFHQGLDVDGARVHLLCAVVRDTLLGLAVVMLLIHVYFNHFVPACGDDGVVLASVANKGYLTFLRVMLVQRQSADPTDQVKNLDFSLMAAHQQLPVVCV